EVENKASSDTIANILEYIKKAVERHYKQKGIPDDFSEHISSDITFQGEGITLRFAIGGCQKNAPNSVIIDGKALESMDVPHLFKTSVEYFQPDWGVVTQFNFVDVVLKQTIE